MVGSERHFLRSKKGRGIALSEQGMHLSQVHCHADQIPLSLHAFEASKHKLPEAQYMFDHAEGEFDGALAPGVERSALLGGEPVLHGGDRVGVLVRRGPSRVHLNAEPLLQASVVLLPPRGNVGRDARFYAAPDVLVAVIARVGQQGFGAAEWLRQSDQAIDRRCQLMDIDGVVRNMVR